MLIKICRALIITFFIGNVNIMYFVIYPYKKPLQSAGVLFLMKGVF